MIKIQLVKINYFFNKQKQYLGAHIAGIRGIVKVIPSGSSSQSQKAQFWSKPLPMFGPAQKQSIYIQVSVEIVPVSTKSALWLAPSTSKPGFVPQDKIAIEWDSEQKLSEATLPTWLKTTMKGPSIKLGC